MYTYIHTYIYIHAYIYMYMHIYPTCAARKAGMVEAGAVQVVLCGVELVSHVVLCCSKHAATCSSPLRY